MENGEVGMGVLLPGAPNFVPLSANNLNWEVRFCNPSADIVRTGFLWYNILMKKILPVLLVKILVLIFVLTNNANACDMIDINTGECIIYQGSGDLLNTNTSEYLQELGNGDKIGLNSGELYINQGNGTLLNTSTGSLLIRN